MALFLQSSSTYQSRDPVMERGLLHVADGPVPGTDWEPVARTKIARAAREIARGLIVSLSCESAVHWPCPQRHALADCMCKSCAYPRTILLPHQRRPGADHNTAIARHKPFNRWALTRQVVCQDQIEDPDPKRGVAVTASYSSVIGQRVARLKPAQSPGAAWQSLPRLGVARLTMALAGLIVSPDPAS